jgi:hypothetical protein
MKSLIEKNNPAGFIRNTAIGAALVAGTFLAATLSTRPATAAVIIADGFANLGSNGYVSGYDTSSGSARYNATYMNKPTIVAGTDNTGLINNYWVFSGANYVDSKKLISWNSGAYVQGTIGIASVTSGILDATTIYELQGNGTGDPKWAAVGLLSGTAVSSWTSASGGNLLSASISVNGTWALYENGADTTGTLLAGSTEATQLPAFAAGSVTILTLKFNIEAGTAALFVDNKNISGWIDTTTDAASIAAAGYRVEPESSSKPDPRAFWIDDFSVSVTAAVPESAATAAIVGVLAALALLARRMFRAPLA